MKRRESPDDPLFTYSFPDFHHYPKQFLKNGTRDWARIRFLQACDRIGAPQELWPRFDVVELPARSDFGIAGPTFSLPEFRILMDSPAEWRRRAMVEFQKHCDVFLSECAEKLHQDVERGFLVKIERPKLKGRALAQRYEWAARRHCYNTPYKALATDQHSADMIRKAVAKIMAEIQIGSGNRA